MQTHAMSHTQHNGRAAETDTAHTNNDEAADAAPAASPHRPRSNSLGPAAIPAEFAASSASEEWGWSSESARHHGVRRTGAAIREHLRWSGWCPRIKLRGNCARRGAWALRVAYDTQQIQYREVGVCESL